MNLSASLIRAILHYLRKVTPSGNVEADELYGIITKLEMSLVKKPHK